MKTLTSTILGLALTVLSVSSQSTDLKDIGNIGNLEMENIEGQKFNTNEMTNDGPVLIIIWADWLPKHDQEILDKVNKKYEEWKKETGVKIFAIACDEDEKTKQIKAHIALHSLQFDVLEDPKCQLFHKLKIKESVPTVIITDGKNNVKWTLDGYEPDDENLYIEVLRKMIAK